MKSTFRTLTVVPLLTVFAFAGCRQAMVISKVDYSQPIETVLVPDEQGMVNDVEHGIKFSILPLQYAETKDTTFVTTKPIRMIRGKEGYYYITSDGYRHVYVMAPDKGILKLKNKIAIKEQGISDPAFNQRDPYVQLISQETGEQYTITADGIRTMRSKQISNK